MTKDINKRWIPHCYKKCVAFYNAIQKYSWDGFEHIVLTDNLTKTEASNLEIDLIAKYDTTNSKNGYNISVGGLGGYREYGEHHRSAKIVSQYDLSGNLIKTWGCMSDAAKVLNIPLQDIHHVCNGNYGAKSAGGYQWRYGNQKLITPYIKGTGSSKPVYQLDMNLNIVNQYNCMSDAEKGGYSSRSIFECCHRKSLCYHGYFWCFQKDYDDFKVYLTKNLRVLKDGIRNKEVYQYNLNGVLLHTYKNVPYASKVTGISKDKLRNYCNESSQDHGSKTGFMWRYAIDVLTEKLEVA